MDFDSLKDSLLSLSSSPYTPFLTALGLCCGYLVVNLATRKAANLPPGPPQWPVVGVRLLASLSNLLGLTSSPEFVQHASSVRVVYLWGVDGEVW
jgi:hypothetical protein